MRAWELDRHLEAATKICNDLGYEVHIVPTSDDIPGVRRDFEECLHYRGEIWHSLCHVPVEGLWHEAGHALVAELMDCGMRDLGVHWIVYGKVGSGLERERLHVSEESPACQATRSLMIASGVPKIDRDPILEYVAFFEDDEDPTLLKSWDRVVHVWKTSGIEEARVLYRTLISPSSLADDE